MILPSPEKNVLEESLPPTAGHGGLEDGSVACLLMARCGGKVFGVGVKGAALEPQEECVPVDAE